MTTNPFLSVITITLNNREGLNKTAASLRSQIINTCDYEWIIVDGASTDGTAEDLKNHTHAHIISEPDNGIYDAMNKGLARARGDYILFLNAGDVFASDTVIEAIKPYAADQVDLIYGDGLEQRPGQEPAYKKARDWSQAHKGMFTYHQSMIYRRFLAQATPFNLAYRVSSDYDFTLRFLNSCRGIRYVPQALCMFEPGGFSQNHAQRARLEEFLIRENLAYGTRLQNMGTFLRQTLAWQLRRLSPQLYWHLVGLRPQR